MALAALAALSACGGTSTTGDLPPASFSGAEVEVVPTDSGQLSLGLRWSPLAPVRGENAAELTLTDATGAPIDGLTVTVTPWMPAHAHGTSVQPETTTSAPGVFVVQPLYLFMSGEWELRTTVDGAIHDTVTATVEIP
jgi:hypothetical protein